MDRKIILLTIISCINADHLNTNLLPPDLPPANVANIYHESGITFVSPTSNVEISSSVLAPTIPITHAFGFVEHSPNGPQELVRTHSSQLVRHGLRSSLSAFSSPNGIHTNINGPITSHRDALDDGHSPQISLDIAVQSPPSDVVQARFVENEHHAVHEINSRTQHFEYKVPFPRNVPQHGHHFDHHDNFERPTQIARQHLTYGVPSHTPSQISSSETPTFIPSHVSSSAPSQIPSQFPSQTPSHVSSNAPSQLPSQTPTFIPSHVSSSGPSQIPFQIPSQTPTFIPSQIPSQLPSQTPTFIPSHLPSSGPFPSQIPSQFPSETPTFIPSNIPSQDEPTFIPTQEEIDALPVFQNDKFLSPFARRTKTPITHSNIAPSPQIIDSIFDKSFRPTARTTVNTFEPSPVHSVNTPTTRTSENIIGGNNRYENRFSLPDGTKVSEQGKLISPQVGWENVIAKTGEYEYVSPEGIPVKVKWIADHEGFRHL